MAIANRLHPVRFNLETQCGVRDPHYQQLVQVGDPTQFQFLLDVCASEKNMVINPTFMGNSGEWLSNGGWGGFASYAVHDIGTSNFIGQDFDVDNGVLMKVTFSFQVLDGNIATNVILQAGTHLSGYSKGGDYTVYISAQSWVSLKIWALSDTKIKLTSLRATPINTNFTFRIIDRNDTEVAAFNSVTDPIYFVFAEDSMTVTYDWTGLPDGCYRIQVADPCACGQGGFVAMDLITVQNQWSPFGGLWSVGNGVINFLSSGAGLNTLSIANFGCRYKTYKITYEIASIGGGGSVSTQIGNNFTGAPAHTTTGVKVDYITTTAFASDYDFRFSTNAGGAGESFDIIDLTVEIVDLDYGFTSVPFDLHQVAPCSVVVAGCCNLNVLQSRFINTGFRPMIRLAALYGQGYYLSREEMEERSDGYKGIYYFRNREIRLLKFGAPKYVHDFMANLRAYDHCWIDDDYVQYEGEGYDKPNYVDNFNYGTVTLEVSDKVQLIEKRTPRISEKSCAVDGQGLSIRTDTGPSWTVGRILVTEKKQRLKTG